MNSTRKVVLLMLLGAPTMLLAQSTDPPKSTANATEKKSNEKASQGEASSPSRSQDHHKATPEYDNAAPSAPAPAQAATPRPSTGQSSGDSGEGNATPVGLGDPPVPPKQNTK